MFGSKFQIALDVTSRIDDGGSAGLLLTDQVRSVSEAIEIELLEDQVSLDLFEVAKQYRGERTGQTRAPRRKNWRVL